MSLPDRTPNNPVELTAHSVHFVNYFQYFSRGPQLTAGVRQATPFMVDFCSVLRVGFTEGGSKPAKARRLLPRSGHSIWRSVVNRIS